MPSKRWRDAWAEEERRRERIAPDRGAWRELVQQQGYTWPDAYGASESDKSATTWKLKKLIFFSNKVEIELCLYFDLC